METVVFALNSHFALGEKNGIIPNVGEFELI